MVPVLSYGLMVGCCMVWHGIPLCCGTLWTPSLVWYAMVSFFGVECYGFIMVWYGMVRYDMVWKCKPPPGQHGAQAEGEEHAHTAEELDEATQEPLERS